MTARRKILAALAILGALLGSGAAAAAASTGTPVTDAIVYHGYRG